MKAVGPLTVRWCEIRASFTLVAGDGRKPKDPVVAFRTLYLFALAPGQKVPTQVTVAQGSEQVCRDARHAVIASNPSTYRTRGEAVAEGAILGSMTEADIVELARAQFANQLPY